MGAFMSQFTGLHHDTVNSIFCSPVYLSCYFGTSFCLKLLSGNFSMVFIVVTGSLSMNLFMIKDG